jgi:GT2 family glycosyltransferase
VTPTLSVVIVSFNVRADLLRCLESIYASRQDAAFAVWVVDNASRDESAAAVAEQFPQVRLVRNCDNVGFARANNQALRAIDSEFVLLLNPDTLVGNHVFDETIAFLRGTPRAATVSCKLVTANGSLDLACRRSFPTAFDGLCRAAGLSRLFPRSPHLARYNVTYLDENQTSEVDAINGAFMMVRRAAIDEVGLLDEDYFMYMEDLDWCYRFKAAGWGVFYHPTTTVVHLKGRSGRQNSGRMIRAFFESMELFVRKHYRPRQAWLMQAGTRLGIRLWMHATLWRNALRVDKRVTP